MVEGGEVRGLEVALVFPGWHDQPAPAFANSAHQTPQRASQCLSLSLLSFVLESPSIKIFLSFFCR